MKVKLLEIDKCSFSGAGPNNCQSDSVTLTGFPIPHTINSSKSKNLKFFTDAFGTVAMFFALMFSITG